LCPASTGIVNAKAVDVSSDGSNVVVTTKRTKTTQQPLKATSSATFKKNARKVLRSVGKEVASYRPDLKVGGGGSDGGWPFCGGGGGQSVWGRGLERSRHITAASTSS
jgi:hypothetical protein